MRNLRKFFWAVVRSLLTTIPISLIPAGLIIFGTNVIFGKNVSFLVIWRWTYLVMLAVSLLYDSITLTKRYIMFSKAAKRLNMPYSVIEQAVLDYRFDRQLPVQEWTSEWLKMNLAAREAAKDIMRGAW